MWVVLQQRLMPATLIFACTGLLFLSISENTVASEPVQDYRILQKNAMAMARSGEYPEAIAILEKILRQSPDDKRIKRSLIAVYSWSGDCRHSLGLFRQFNREDIDDRVSVAAVSDCLIKDERYLEANAILTPAREKYGYDRKILNLYLQVRAKLAKYKPWYNYNGIELGASDIGGHSIIFESELSREINDATSLFTRLKLGEENDPAFGYGNLKRLGVGFEHRFYSDLNWRAELSANIEGNTDTGLGSRLEYPYNDNLKVSAEYVTYAGDISLPAIGLGITADRFRLSSEFHNDGYAFKGSASAGQYRFSDSNLRQNMSVDLSYAYSREDDRWRRFGVAIDHETNTYLAASYFNPIDGNSVVFYHSWEIPFLEKGVKHRDRLTLKAGMYAQRGYDTDAISEILYEQKFELTDDSSISAGYSLMSNVFDGVRETDAVMSFSFERSF